MNSKARQHFASKFYATSSLITQLLAEDTIIHGCKIKQLLKLLQSTERKVGEGAGGDILKSNMWDSAELKDKVVYFGFYSSTVVYEM